MNSPNTTIEHLLKQSDELKFSVVQKIHGTLSPLKLKESLDSLCNLENSLLNFYDQAKKGANVGKTIAELKRVLEEVQVEINLYIGSIAKVPYSEFLSSIEGLSDSNNNNDNTNENKEVVSTPLEDRYYYCLKYYYELPFRSLNIKASRDADSYTNKINSNADDVNYAVEIPFDEIKFDPVKDYLGEGSFGKVFRATVRKREVAVKEPLKQKLSKTETDAFVQEVRTMSKIFNPNVVLMLGACTNPDPAKGERIRIVMEYCPSDVEKILKNDRKQRKPPEVAPSASGTPQKTHSNLNSSSSKGILTMPERVRLAKEAALGMNWLHGINSVVHGDLKTANLLVDENGHVKVSDFGFSVVKTPNQIRHEKQPVGTPLYMPPEVMKNVPYDGFKADVYAFAMIMWEIATSDKLFAEFKEWAPFKQAVCNGHRPYIPYGPPSIKKQSLIVHDIPYSWCKLIRRCWDEDPKQRPSFHEILFRLDEVYVDAYLSDKEAAKWWKDLFLFPKQDLITDIPWSQFKQALLQSLPGLEKEKLDKAKSLLTKESSDNSNNGPTCSISYFNQLVQTFGYFFLPSQGPALIDFIVHLNQQTWFHGFIDRETAEDRLRGRKAGTYLVRLSTSKPGCPYALSSTGERGVTHRVIQYDPIVGSKYIVNIHGVNREFDTLTKLLEFDELKLRKACPPSIITRYGDPDEDD